MIFLDLIIVRKLPISYKCNYILIILSNLYTSFYYFCFCNSESFSITFLSVGPVAMVQLLLSSKEPFTFFNNPLICV